MKVTPKFALAFARLISYSYGPHGTAVVVRLRLDNKLETIHDPRRGLVFEPGQELVVGIDKAGHIWLEASNWQEIFSEASWPLS